MTSAPMVIPAIKLDGLNKSEASLLFNISRNTIDLWLKRQAETGDFQALPNLPPGNGHKITDWEKFREFAQVHGDKTLFRDGKTLGGADQRSHYLTSSQENWLYSKKVNMIAAVCNHNLIAPFTVEGACHRTVFETWLASCLLPLLKAGQVVVMDHARFHSRWAD